MAKHNGSRLTRIQQSLGLATRRARDGALHEHLGRRVGYQLEAPYYATLARLRLTDGLTMSELALGLGMEVSTVSRRINELEKRGLVQRVTGTEDRRTSFPTLTAEGAEVASMLEVGWREMLSEVTADWSAADLETFATLFERFAADFDRYAREIFSQPPGRLRGADEDSRRK
ncbi:MAG TPA: MarR family transcriptional regulator [Mycobacteriales bacterium]|nr:MarR family transcriptional regulator [Mycobacteriales bacterium]